MNPSEPAALTALDQSLGEAIELAKHARFGDLTAKAEALQSDAAALAGLRAEIARSGPEAEIARRACERVRRKIFVLAEIFRHASVVQAGLLGLHQTITTPYASSGRLPASRNPFALSGNVDQEA
jgi:hypothetical protein